MRLMLMLVLATLLVGCRTEPVIIGDTTFPTRHTYSVAPKTLYEKVKAVIGVPIASESDGRIITDWVPEAGATFGVGSLGRTYEERTRYTITISSAWDDPNKSTLEVTEETQQRSQKNYDWESGDLVERPERAALMAKKIDSALAASAK